MKICNNSGRVLLLTPKKENNMKTLKIASAVALASMVASSALAASGDLYGRLDAGYAMSKAKFTGTANQTVKANSFTGNVGLGYYYTDAVRVDVNFGYTPGTATKIKSGTLNGDKLKVSSYTGMVNAYYDFTGMDIVPYVTIGGGVTSLKAKLTGATTPAKYKGKLAFAYQAGLGAAYEVTSGVFLDAGYRFTGNSFKKSTGTLALKPQPSHSFLIGARVNF